VDCERRGADIPTVIYRESEFFSYLPKNSFMRGDIPKNKCTPAIER
jgi:hypothetical protein